MTNSRTVNEYKQLGKPLPDYFTVRAELLPKGLPRSGEINAWLLDNRVRSLRQHSIWIVTVWDMASAEFRVARAAYANTEDGFSCIASETAWGYDEFALVPTMDKLGFSLLETDPIPSHNEAMQSAAAHRLVV